MTSEALGTQPLSDAATPAVVELPAHVDILVIGAGITGVQIAREAAARGRSVLIVDKGDFGGGTSAATTKFIHGGIRYLEQYDFKVVRESLRERRIVALSAPHLVRHLRFLLPVWSWSKPNALLLSAGALVYDALAFDRNRGAPDALRIGHPRWLSRRAALAAVPWLDPTELRGAVAITDTLNIHPERLLLEYLRDAEQLGAVARNHHAVTGFITDRGPDDRLVVRGAELTDTLTGATATVHAGTVVNAGGPWMGSVLDRLRSQAGKRIGPSVSPSKGIHVLTYPVAQTGVPAISDAVLARARNGRHVMVSPWMGREFVGPTDTPIDAAPDDVAADTSDVDLVLDVVNACRRSEHHLDTSDVDDVTVGIRPLVAEDGADTYNASRRHQLYDHADDGVLGLWSIAGGKWTTGRAIAEDVVDHLLSSSGRRGSSTRTRAVPGASGWADEPRVVFDTIAAHRPDAGVAPALRTHLARLYGTRATRVIDLIADDPALGTRLSDRPGALDVAAQVVVAVTDEQARTLSDIVDRRLILGTLGRVSLAELTAVARLAAPLLGWDDDGAAVAAHEHERREARRAVWLERPTTPA